MSDEQLNKIEGKVDRLDEHLSRIDITLAAQHVSLKEHIRRTEILEQTVSPLKVTADKWQGLKDLLLLVSALAALCVSILATLHYLGRL